MSQHSGEPSSRPHLDVQALRDALDQQRRAKKLSWRQLAAEAGVSSSTLTRMSQGKRPDVDSFAALVAWLGVPSDTFLRGARGAGLLASKHKTSAFSAHLRADKNPSAGTIDALQDLWGAVERLIESRGSGTPREDKDGEE